LILLGLLVVGFLLGPKSPTPKLEVEIPMVPTNLLSLENFVNEQEASTANIRSDNEARIVWMDSLKYRKAPCSIVYLHGFSASQGEADPLHRELAEHCGCHLYLSRLPDHGLELGEESMLNVTPEKMLKGAAEALAIGEKLGEKVYIMSCSTGSTLGITLAAQHPESVDGLLCYSPNIAVHDTRAKHMTGPWGLQLLRLMFGGKHRTYETPEGGAQYATNRYRLEALLAMQSLVNHSMTPTTWEKITQPIFMGYWYKSDDECDKTVSIPAMKEAYEHFSTPENQKSIQAFPNVGAHIMASPHWSKDMESVRRETLAFGDRFICP